MTQAIINDVPPYTQASASGGQTVFGTNWSANYASDVVVYYTPVGSPPDDQTQILSYPSQYSVAFIGGLLQVQVTLVTPANLNDKVTITRMTPADRENLYNNTNFLPSMLNNDFGILTFVDQQAQLVNQAIAPRYNYSATINPNPSYPTMDTILPLLPANCGWVKNSGDTAIVAYQFPSSGIAPSDGTYVLLTANSALPDAFALSSLGAGLLVNNPAGPNLEVTSVTGTSNQITIANGNGLGGALNVGITPNPILPGTAGMGIPEGTTAQRVTPSSNIGLRYNTSLNVLEYYNGSWIQLGTSASEVFPGLVNQLAWYAANGSAVSGLPTLANGLLVTDAGSVPSISTTLPSGLIIPGYANEPVNTNITSMTGLTGYLSAPLGIKDSSGNKMFDFSYTANAVNYFGFINNSTGNQPAMVAIGADANINFQINGKGTGGVLLYGDNTGIYSSASLPIVTFGATASAVDYLILTNSIAPSSFEGPTLSVAGSSTNINLDFQTKGVAAYNFLGTSTASSVIRVFEQTTNGTNFVGLHAPASLSGNQDYYLPSADGTADAPLITDGSGNLSFLPAAWTTFTPGFTGFTGAVGIGVASYKKIGNTCFINLAVSGTSNATGFTITGLPFTAAVGGTWIPFNYCFDNGVNNVASGTITGTTLTLYLGTNSQVAGWHNSGAKDYAGEFNYETV